MRESIARSLWATEAPPANFITFLQKRGWRRRGKALRGASTWSKPFEGRLATVLVPEDRGTVDYAAVLASAIQVAAEIEDVEPSELVAKLFQPDAALLRLTLRSAQSDAAGIPLTIANSAVEAVGIICEGAALQAALGNGLSARSARELALRYGADVRVTDIALGSLRVTAVLPQLLPVPQGVGSDSVPTLLAKGLQRIERSTKSALRPNAIEMMELQDWPLGTYLIRALDRFAPDAVRSVGFDVPNDEETGPRRLHIAQFSAESLATAHELAAYVEPRRGSAIYDQAQLPYEPMPVTVLGAVLELRRPRLLVVDGEIEGRRRRFHIRQVPEHLYDRAIIAYRDNTPVEVTGILTLRGRSAEILDVSEVRIA